MLARMYPGLRIAYVDEKEGSFYSVLAKHVGPGDQMEEEYRVRVRGWLSMPGGGGRGDSVAGLVVEIVWLVIGCVVYRLLGRDWGGRRGG